MSSFGAGTKRFERWSKYLQEQSKAIKRRKRLISTAYGIMLHLEDLYRHPDSTIRLQKFDGNPYFYMSQDPVLIKLEETENYLRSKYDTNSPIRRVIPAMKTKMAERKMTEAEYKALLATESIDDLVEYIRNIASRRRVEPREQELLST